MGNEIFIHGKSNAVIQNNNDIESALNLTEKLQQTQVAECDMINNSSKDNTKSNLDLCPTVLATELKCDSNFYPASKELEKSKAMQPKTCHEINNTVTIENSLIENRNTPQGIVWAFPMGGKPKKKRKRKTKKKLLNC